MLRVEEFSEELARTATPAESFALLKRTIEALGYNAFDYGFGTGRVPHPTSPTEIEFHHYTASQNWENRYFELGYAAYDFCTARTLAQVAPHTYAQTAHFGLDSPVRRQLLGDVEDSGINSGLAIPMHMMGNRFGLLHIGSRLTGSEFERLDRETRPTVTLIAQIFHDRMSRDQWPADQIPPLSPRELECLRWAAQGKTHWETGEILSIAERTVKKHLASAMLKLGATTRTQAVAKAVSLGFIVP